MEHHYTDYLFVLPGVIVYLARTCMFLLCLAYRTCLPEHMINNAPSQVCWPSIKITVYLCLRKVCNVDTKKAKLADDRFFLFVNRFEWQIKYVSNAYFCNCFDVLLCLLLVLSSAITTSSKFAAIFLNH